MIWKVRSLNKNMAGMHDCKFTVIKEMLDIAFYNCLIAESGDEFAE